MKTPKSLPQNAELKFEGAVFNVYAWEQKMFDGSFETFEKISREDTIVVIPIIDQEILLLDESQPDGLKRFGFPMGRIYDSEKPEEGASRELEEETGIIPEKLLYIESYSTHSKIDWKIHYFIALGVKERRKKNLDSGEKIKEVEVSFDEAYEKFKNLEVGLPKSLTKSLINDCKEDFFDRFLHPEKYFKQIK